MDEYDDGLYWVILLMYGSHDMRHIGFHRLTVVNGTLGFWGVTAKVLSNFIYLIFFKTMLASCEIRGKIKGNKIENKSRRKEKIEGK